MPYHDLWKLGVPRVSSPGDVIDEDIRVAGSPMDAARRVIAVIEAARSHEVVVETPTAYRLVRRYRPGWAVPLVVVKSTESCAVHVTTDRASAEGGTLRLVGRLPRTALAAIRLAAEEPPRYAPPARDARWRTGDADWPAPANVPAPVAVTPALAPLPQTPVAPAAHAADLTNTAKISTVPVAASPLIVAAVSADTAAFPLVPPIADAPAPPAPRTRTDDDVANRTIPRQPRVVAAARPAFAVVFDTGEQIRLDGSVIVGRAPALQPGESGRLLPINDPDFSISKTHLAVGAGSDGPWVMDRHSLNGTAIVRNEGEIACPPGERVLVALGDTVYFGNRRFVLRALSGDIG